MKTKTKKILILCASYGSGHKNIAEYIKNYIKENSNYEINVLNISNYCNLIGKIGRKLFEYNVLYRPMLLADLCYNISNNKLSALTLKKNAINSFDNKKLRKAISIYDPDIVICTHYYGSIITSYYNELKITNAKIITIITDYGLHQFWATNHQNENAIIVGNDIVKNALINKGVLHNKIHVFGIPINFQQKNNQISKDAVLKAYKVKANKPIFLFFGGGTTGTTSYFNYFKKLVNKNYDMQIIFICGKNKPFQDMCDNYIKKENITNVKVLGFTKDVYNLLKISDCVITKSGATVITECMMINKPMIIIPGYGGQEKKNAKYVFQKGYAVIVKGPMGLTREVNKILNNPNILKKMHSNLQKQYKKNAVVKILNYINSI